jgi:hypothetical protein
MLASINLQQQFQIVDCYFLIHRSSMIVYRFFRPPPSEFRIPDWPYNNGSCCEADDGDDQGRDRERRLSGS